MNEEIKALIVRVLNIPDMKPNEIDDKAEMIRIG